jgi:hypothetical protein
MEGSVGSPLTTCAFDHVPFDHEATNTDACDGATSTVPVAMQAVGDEQAVASIDAFVH